MQCHIRKLVVSHDGEVIHIVSKSSADHASRLQFLHQSIKFLALLRLKRSHIKPKFADRAIVCQQFTHLGLAELMMLRSNEVAIMA